MAKGAFPTIPVDTPVEISPGVIHKESAFFGFAQDGRGFVSQQISGDSEVGKLNGARSESTRPPMVAPTKGLFRNLRRK